MTAVVFDFGAVLFQWLHPGDADDSARRASSNSRSCVLRISSPAGVVLLSGDIEAAQEKALIGQAGGTDLRADVFEHADRDKRIELAFDLAVIAFDEFNLVLQTFFLGALSGVSDLFS